MLTPVELFYRDASLPQLDKSGDCRTYGTLGRSGKTLRFSRIHGKITKIDKRDKIKEFVNQ